jgi:hypothetical protein
MQYQNALSVKPAGQLSRQSVPASVVPAGQAPLGSVKPLLSFQQKSARASVPGNPIKMAINKNRDARTAKYMLKPNIRGVLDD